MKMAQHHEDTLLAMQQRCNEVVPPDQRYVIIVYDGPALLTRQLSWLAPGVSQEEAAAIIKQLTDSL